MLYYTPSHLARMFGFSRGWLYQLWKRGKGPKRQDNGRISTEDALAFAERRIADLSNRLETEKDADRYVLAAQRLRVDAFVHAAKHHQPIEVEAVATGPKPVKDGHPIVPVALPTRFVHGPF